MITAAQTPSLRRRVLVLRRADMLWLLIRRSRSGRNDEPASRRGRVAARRRSRRVCQALIPSDANAL
jgi:hypothetical protein